MGTRDPGGDFASSFPPGGKSLPSWGAPTSLPPPRLHRPRARGCFFGSWGLARGGWDAASSRGGPWECLRGVCRGWRGCSQPLRTSNCTSPRCRSQALPFFLSRSFLPSSGPVAPSPSVRRSLPPPSLLLSSSSSLALRSEIRLTSPRDPHVISRPVLRSPLLRHALSSPPPLIAPPPPRAAGNLSTSIFAEEFEKSTTAT